MAGVAPVRLLGPIRALDARSSRSLSSASFVRRTSKTSLLLFLHRNRFPSLHSQSPNWRLGQICSASLKEVNEEEPSTQRDLWKKQTPKPKGAFKYPVRGRSSEPEFPWRAVEEEPSNSRRNYSQGNSVQDKQSESEPTTRINKNGPGSGAAAQRRHLNSRNQGNSSSTRRGDEGGRYATKSNGPPSSSTSRYSQYDTGHNIHRAPWEQRSGRAANSRDRRSPPPMRREADSMEEPNFGDSRWGEQNYQGGGQKSAMARIVEKLRAIGNENSASQMDFNKNRPATETSVFLPRYFYILDCRMSYIPYSYKYIPRNASIL